MDWSAQAPTLRQQIERQIASAIRNGKLPDGARLPSSRLMARLLGVSRGTVVEAYEVSLETGMLTASKGSGVYVAHRPTTIPHFSNLKRTIAAAHYPALTVRFEDCDGTALYFNVIR